MDQADAFDAHDDAKKMGFLEVIEFALVRAGRDGQRMTGIYAINVAKVREVVRMPSINPLASRVNAVAGIFELRGVPIPAIHLARALGDAESAVGERDQIIVAEFAQRRAGFIVTGTRRIRKIPWAKVMPPSGDAQSYMSGMVLLEDKSFLFILDLERIVHDIEGASGFGGEAGATPRLEARPVAMPGPKAPGILLVDDSPLVLNNVTRLLAARGYRVVTAANGQAAFEKLTAMAQGAGHKGNGPIHMVITDLEMPIMDGITLTHKLRCHPVLKGLPVVLHSSLSGPASQSAALSAGANGYVVKNDTQSLLDAVAEACRPEAFAVGA